MSIVRRGPNIYLIRVYRGRDPITKKRLEINETVRGTLSSAKKRHAQLKGQKDAGSFVKNERMTVNRLLDLYLDSNRHTHRENTQLKNKKYANYYIRDYIGDALIDKVKPSDIQKLFNSLLDRLAASTVRGVEKLLHAAFSSAVDDKLLTENPVSKTTLPPLNKSSANSLTREEANAFVAVRNNYHFGDAFVFQLHTGLRPQELLALIWDDVDFEKGTVRVERACVWVKERFTGFGPPKTELSERTIELTSEIMALLRLHFKKQQKITAESEENGSRYGEPQVAEWITKERPKQAHLYASTNLIFPDQHGCVPPAPVPRLQCKAMLREAGINRSNFRWYDLRHTHATLLLTDGEPQKVVAERMGHTVITLMTRYAHVLPHGGRSAATTFQRLVPI